MKTAAERSARWQAGRKGIADLWCGGDLEAADRILEVLPYSSIPDWSDVDRVLSELLALGLLDAAEGRRGGSHEQHRTDLACRVGGEFDTPDMREIPRVIWKEPRFR